MNAWPTLVLLLSAILEVGGDALVRKGMRGGGWIAMAAGCLVLAAYGILVNRVPWDFGRLLGTYVAFFAVVSILCGWWVFGERVPVSTWGGLAVIVLGAVILQAGRG